MEIEATCKIVLGLVLTALLNVSEAYPRRRLVNTQEFEISKNFYGYFLYNYARQNQNKCPAQEYPRGCGYGINCGRGNNTQVWWTPKIVDPRSNVVLFLDVKLPVAVHNITATLDVHIFEEKNPIFTIIQTATCEQLKNMTHEEPQINCPLQKDFPLKTEINLKSLSRLPTGNFTIVTNVTNELNQTVFCVRTSFEIRRNQGIQIT